MPQKARRWRAISLDPIALRVQKFITTKYAGVEPGTNTNAPPLFRPSCTARLLDLVIAQVPLFLTRFSQQSQQVIQREDKIPLLAVDPHSDLMSVMLIRPAPVRSYRPSSPVSAIIENRLVHTVLTIRFSAVRSALRVDRRHALSERNSSGDFGILLISS